MSGPTRSFPLTGGVYLAPDVCYPIWKVLQREMTERANRDGVRLAPAVQEAMQALRAAAQAHMSPSGHAERTFTDIAIASEPERREVTTSELAGLLKVCNKSARRIAETEGIEPLGRNRWSYQDARHLEAKRFGRSN